MTCLHRIKHLFMCAGAPASQAVVSRLPADFSLYTRRPIWLTAVSLGWREQTGRVSPGRAVSLRDSPAAKRGSVAEV